MAPSKRRSGSFAGGGKGYAMADHRGQFTYNLASNEEGKHAAYREEEPVFWLIRDSEVEAIAAADATFREYAEKFGKGTTRFVTRELVVHQFKPTREIEAS